LDVFIPVWDLPVEYRYKNYSCLAAYPDSLNDSQLGIGYHENMLVGHTFNNILNRKDSTDNSGGIEDILQDRKNIIRSKIELILLQLGQRKIINHDVIKSISYDLCNAQTLLMEMGYENKSMDRNRLTLERIKFDLEGQSRMEQTSYFRDIGMLNRDLTDTLIQYIDHVQKDSIINQMEGDL